MKKMMLLVGWLAVSMNVSAADALNERQPFKLVTQERAAAAVKEMDFYFSGELSSKISSDKSGEVQSSLQNSEKLRQQAKQAFGQNDYPATLRFANNAIKSFLDTAHLTSHPSSVADKQEQLYQRNQGKLNTFIKALAQAIQDSAQQSDGGMQEVVAMQTEASKLAEQKKFSEANFLLGKALLAVKLNINMLMRGSTQLAEKDNSPKGIYEYEAFRNETYKSLVDLLHTDAKFVGETTNNELMLKVETQAEKLHIEATELAKVGNYPDASKKMEESTVAYKNAVRQSGVVLPAVFLQILGMQ